MKQEKDSPIAQNACGIKIVDDSIMNEEDPVTIVDRLSFKLRNFTIVSSEAASGCLSTSSLFFPDCVPQVDLEAREDNAIIW